MTREAENLLVAICEEYYNTGTRKFSFNTYHHLRHGDDERAMNELIQEKYIRKVEKLGQTIYVIYLEEKFFKKFGIENY